MLSVSELRTLWLKNFESHPELVIDRATRDIETHRKGCCKLRVLDSQGNPLKNQAVTIKQTSHDFKFGAHIFMLDEFQDEADNLKFREMFKEYFNLATVPFYWCDLEPEKGKSRYEKNSKKIYRRPAPELCLEYCEENGIDTKLHCLVYERYAPEWLPKKDMKQMEAAYATHFKEIADRFAGRMVEFEVINETLGIHEWTTNTEIANKEDLNEWAFSLARKYFPNETLMINEGYMLDEVALRGIWSNYYLEIQNALLKGVVIDKIGMQHHIFTGAADRTPEEYADNLMNPPYGVCADKIFKCLDTMAKFGLPMEITEVTIPTFGEGEEYEELQAEILKYLYTIWFSHPAIDTIVYWNQIEGYCYDAGPEANWNENRCRGGLFHHDLTPKKSALMLKKLITKDWCTKLSLTTDDCGYVEFRGFYGNYEAECNGHISEFHLYKNGNNAHNLTFV